MKRRTRFNRPPASPRGARPRTTFALWLFFAAATATCAQAATVRWVGLPELVTRSALIFEGRVIEESSRLVRGGRGIVTDIEFEVSRTLKGTDPGSRLVLTFSGGRIGDLALAVHGSRRPDIGETGIYFVEQPIRSQVHPFYGWSQGHFLTREDPGSGVTRIFSSDGRPVIRIRSVTSPDTPVAASVAAAGVELAALGSDSEAMTLGAFRELISETVERR